MPYQPVVQHPAHEKLVERNDRLTRVGPGTPMGKYMRCFWHPVAASVELKKHADLPGALPAKLHGGSTTRSAAM